MATKSDVESVVRATAAKFPRLTAQGNNTTVMVELLRRMIWNLWHAGISAGRQQNPSGAISGDKLTAMADGRWRAYDVLSDRESGPFDVHCDEVFPAVNVTDAGIADPVVTDGPDNPPAPPNVEPAPWPTDPRVTDGLTDVSKKLEAVIGQQSKLESLLKQTDDNNERRFLNLTAQNAGLANVVRALVLTGSVKVPYLGTVTITLRRPE